MSGKITISYKCDEFQIDEVQFNSNEDIITFMSWNDIQKQQYAIEQNIVRKIKSLKSDREILAKLNEQRRAYESEQDEIGRKKI